MNVKIATVAALLFALAACGEKPVEAPKVVAAPVQGPNLTQVPDVGKVEQVNVTALGTGMTPGAAVNDALKTAISQVNGTTVDASSANVNMFAKATATVDVESSQGKDSATVTGTLQSQAFAEQIITQSKGTVSSFKVVSVAPPPNGNGVFTVNIEAKIAKFKGPADSGKIKIVVAPLKSEKMAFNIGGRMIPANEVLGPLRQQIIDNLTQTGRFTILDRQFDGELQNEMNMITSGQTDKTDLAKLGQALSADLVWVGVVNDFAFNKTVRKLQTSDRELVSYAGGWSVSQRMINLATKQIMQSNTLEGVAPAIAATTLGANFDETGTVKTMAGDFVKKSTEAILLRTFPVSVVERDGDTVVLSQGGKALTEGTRYRIYRQGKEIKDPQTGQSLGNMESLCCDVVIDRVTPNLSYGTLERVKIKLDDVVAGALQIREAVPAQVAKAPSGDAVTPPEKKAEPVAKTPSDMPATTAVVAKAKTAPKAEGTKKEDW